MISQYQAAKFGKLAYELFEEELLKSLEETFNKLEAKKELR